MTKPGLGGGGGRSSGGGCGNERRNQHISVAFNFNGQFGCSLGFGHVHFVCNIH